MAERFWSETKLGLRKDEDWDVWFEWYEAVSRRQTPWPEPAAIAIFALPESDWQAGPALVNRKIKDILARSGFANVLDTGSTPDQIRTAKTANAPSKRPSRKTAPPPAPVSSLASETRLQSDRPQAEEDYLARAEMAFALAGRINRIWDQNVADGAKTGADHAGFAIHIDAPWGGGKTSFANYLARILNHASTILDKPRWMERLPMEDADKWPENFRRRWFIVNFNAWEHQNVAPPWWVLYETIRRSIFQQIKEPREGSMLMVLYAPVHRARARLREYAWRFKTPEIISSAVPLAIAVVLAITAVYYGFVTLKEDGSPNFLGNLPGYVTLIALDCTPPLRHA